MGSKITADGGCESRRSEEGPAWVTPAQGPAPRPGDSCAGQSPAPADAGQGD